MFLLLQHPSSLYEIIRRGIICCFGHFKLLLLEGKGVFVVVFSWNTHMMSIGSLGVKTSTYRHLHLLLFCCFRLEITVSTRHLRHRPFRTLASKQSETAYKIRAQCNSAFRFFSSSFSSFLFSFKCFLLCNQVCLTSSILTVCCCCCCFVIFFVCLNLFALA